MLDAAYYFCNFSVSLKLLQNKKCSNEWREKPQSGRRFSQHIINKEIHKEYIKKSDKTLKKKFKNVIEDFPGGPVGKTPCSQCSGPVFDPWWGN